MLPSVLTDYMKLGTAKKDSRGGKGIRVVGSSDARILFIRLSLCVLSSRFYTITSRNMSNLHFGGRKMGRLSKRKWPPVIGGAQ